MTYTLQILGVAVASLVAFVTVQVIERNRTPDSPIVATVEAAGGSVADASVDDLLRWFYGGHVQVAQQVVGACRSRAENVPSARWGLTDEGRICRAVISAVSYDNLAHPPKFVATN